MKSFTFKGKNDIIHKVKGVVEMNKNKNTNTYNEIENAKEKFEKISKDIVDKNIIDKIINKLSDILKDNNNEIERYTIKRTINQYNSENYEKCNNILKEILEDRYKLENMKFNNFMGKTLMQGLMMKIEELNEKIEKNILSYKASLKK